MKTCSIAGCLRKFYARDYCEMHYARWSRDPERVTDKKKTGRPREDLKERFWKSVEKTETCWLWTGSFSGYGRIAEGGRYSKTLLAHRVAYELLVGPIPEGLTIDHLCKNTRCVNPTHLEVVTFGVNVLRGDTVTGNNARKTHCNNGHPLPPYIPGGIRVCKVCKLEGYHRRRHEGKRS